VFFQDYRSTESEEHNLFQSEIRNLYVSLQCSSRYQRVLSPVFYKGANSRHSNINGHFDYLSLTEQQSFVDVIIHYILVPATSVKYNGIFL